MNITQEPYKNSAFVSKYPVKPKTEWSFTNAEKALLKMVKSDVSKIHIVNNELTPERKNYLYTMFFKYHNSLTISRTKKHNLNDTFSRYLEENPNLENPVKALIIIQNEHQIDLKDLYNLLADSFLPILFLKSDDYDILMNVKIMEKKVQFYTIENEELKEGTTSL